MRFIDANVFLYAVVKPRGGMSGEILERKEKAKLILRRVESGEETVITTVVRVGEVANTLEAKAGLETALSFVENVLLAENIGVLPVLYEDYLKALSIAKENRVSLNDALAYVKMITKGVNEIYTFDNHFKNIPVETIQE